MRFGRQAEADFAADGASIVHPVRFTTAAK
jgi:hypothetical protein